MLQSDANCHQITFQHKVIILYNNHQLRNHRKTNGNSGNIFNEDDSNETDVVNFGELTLITARSAALFNEPNLNNSRINWRSCRFVLLTVLH